MSMATPFANPMFRDDTREDTREDAKVEASCELPTEFGHFRVYVFTRPGESAEHLAIVSGDVWGREQVLTRVHSECLTGDVLGSLRCDCRVQLEKGLRRVAAEPAGIVLYLRQEGRGIGLTNKIRAYRLQQTRGLDTVDANKALGFPDDLREYDIAAEMLKTLGVRSIRLLTNNPEKIRQLREEGIRVDDRVEHFFEPGDHNRDYLRTKAARSGHLLPTLPLRREE
jgi:GTP cyclohydrolase II